MKQKYLLLVILALIMLATNVFADSLQVQKRNIQEIKSQLESAFPMIKVDNIKEINEKSSLFEVVTTGRVVYFDASTNYLLVGTLIDSKGNNLTQARLSEVSSEMIKKIFPDYKDSALLAKRGEGEPVYVITDPDCPFCNKVMEHLKNKPNPVYVFFYPLEQIHPTAKRKSLYLINKLNGQQADYYELKTLANDPSTDLSSSEKAESILKKHAEFAQKIGVGGVPVIISHMKKVEGANIPAIDQLLN